MNQGHSREVQEIARELVQLAERENWQGVTGDGVAISAAQGALAAAAVTKGRRHSLTLDLELFAEGVAIWGLAYMKQTAAGEDRHANDDEPGDFDHDWYD